jgi:hypothetical protein
MGDLRAWVEMVPEGWDFGPEADHISPWRVTVRRPILTPGESEPVKTIITRFVDGKMVDRRELAQHRERIGEAVNRPTVATDPEKVSKP